MPKTRILTGAELKFAAKNKLPVHYVEKNVNPHDKHLCFDGICVMKPATVGFYIGNSDIEPERFKDQELVQGEFPEGTFEVRAAPGHSYVPAPPKVTRGRSKCSACSKRVSKIIGCPDGAEICQECFDAGLH